MFLIFLILCFVIKTFCCGGSYSDIWELVTYILILEKIDWEWEGSGWMASWEQKISGKCRLKMSTVLKLWLKLAFSLIFPGVNMLLCDLWWQVSRGIYLNSGSFWLVVEYTLLQLYSRILNSHRLNFSVHYHPLTHFESQMMESQRVSEVTKKISPWKYERYSVSRQC